MDRDRRTVSTAIAASAVVAGLQTGAARAAQAAPAKARNVVLAHGLYADGSSWLEVIPLLQAAGLAVVSVQHPLTTLAQAADWTRRALARLDGPTILAGHSFGGTIISEAGDRPDVSALVFVSARAPDAGEDWAALAKTYPTPPAAAGTVFDGDEGRLNEETFLRDFASDLPPAQAKALYAVQWPFQRTLTAEKTTVAAWRSKPSFYAVSARDRVVDPGLQRYVAKRMNATTVEIPSGHLPMLSHPAQVADLILRAAGAA